MPTISLIQHKGGSGKTTDTLGLAMAAKLERPSRPVFIIDLDPQRSATTWIRENELPFELKGQPGPDDLVFIDTPGLDPVVTGEGIRRADLLVIPIRASMLDWRVTEMTIKAVVSAKKNAAWLPSQQIPRRRDDRDLASRTLPEAMKSGAIPSWPILPGIRSLASVHNFLAGSSVRSPAAADFSAAWKAVQRIIRKG